MVKNSETLMLQDVWRQALRRGGMNVTFKTKAGAVRARLQLYNAVRAVKEGRDVDDLELVHAAEELQITWINQTTIRIAPKEESDAMQGLMQALGKATKEYVDPEAQASAERMLKELGIQQETGKEEEPERRVPFYGKRGE